MSDPISGSAGAGFGLAKLASSPGAIGILGGALGFAVLWPKTAREGICRIAVSGLSSHFFGDATLRTIINFAPWIPADEIQAGAYLLAALPAWWILGAVIRYLNRGQDIKEIANDVKEVLKNES